MEEFATNITRELKRASLYNRFLDSSYDETSSSASVSESTSTEVGRMMESIRNDCIVTIANSVSSSIAVGFKTTSLIRPQKRESNKSSTTDESCAMGMHPVDVPLCVKSINKTDINKNHSYCPHLNVVATEPTTSRKKSFEEPKVPLVYSIAKMTLMVVIWILCTIVLIEKKEKVASLHQISVPANETKSFSIDERPENDLVNIVLEGAFLPHYYANLSSSSLSVWIEQVLENEYCAQSNSSEDLARLRKNVTTTWDVPIVSEEMIDVVPDLIQSKVLQLESTDCGNSSNCSLRLRLRSNLQSSFPVAIKTDISAIDIEDGVVYAAVILFVLYITIIFELLHRTLAGMLAATISVAILAALNERPTVSELASWIDFETLLLLFSMMVLVAVFSETGIFDYLSVCTYQITNGHIWPLIITLCLLSAFMSSLVDNVTTSLLMTPVTIRLCEVMELNPISVLMAVMIFSNIGGALTPVGDPPNVIVSSYPEVKAAGVDFGVFILHMGIGLILVGITVIIQLKYMFSKSLLLRSDDPLDVQDLKHEIAIWERAAASLSSYSKDEDVVKETLLKRVRRLLSELKSRLTAGRKPSHCNYSKTLEDLKKKYPIKNISLLYKSGFALSFVIVVFFLHSIPDLHLSLGCTAFMGAILLLILADQTNVEGVLARVEWSTLIFFASLFVVMEAISRLRLIEWIGHRTEILILDVNPNFRLPISIVLILWISAGVSAFLDNIPLTSMMIRIVTSISQNPELELPLLPHVWALSFGACLGGIATLVGSSCNLVCAGIAEQHGYRFSFVQYSKVGVPVAVVSLLVVTSYLLIVHVAIGWNL